MVKNNIMGSNRFEETPKAPDNAAPDVKLYAYRGKGIIISTDNKFFIRLWFQLTNPFRYIFTGKIKY